MIRISSSVSSTSPALALAMAIGYDAAGRIESVGPDVSRFKVGDRVSTVPAVSLIDYPAHAEAVVYPETALFAYPQNLGVEQAASVNLGLFTAYFALVELARLEPNRFVVITAASSSMGMAAIQLEKLWEPGALL